MLFFGTLHSDASTLLIVSFAVQKLSSLIRSHLFTFVSISVALGGGAKRASSINGPGKTGQLHVKESN